MYFTFELAISLLGNGFEFYYAEKYNWFDSGVILVSAIDIAL